MLLNWPRTEWYEYEYVLTNMELINNYLIPYIEKCKHSKRLVCSNKWDNQGQRLPGQRLDSPFFMLRILKWIFDLKIPSKMNDCWGVLVWERGNFMGHHGEYPANWKWSCNLYKIMAFENSYNMIAISTILWYTMTVDSNNRKYKS